MGVPQMNMSDQLVDDMMTSGQINGLQKSLWAITEYDAGLDIPQVGFGVLTKG